MRLYEFERNNITSKEALSNALNKNCSTFLKANQMLYRGVERTVMYPFVSDIRLDRTPLHSSEFDVAIFDYYMEKLKLPVRKSNSLSASKRKTQTHSYGNTILTVYPYDQTLYVISKTLGDFMGLAGWVTSKLHRQKNIPTEETPTLDDCLEFINQNFDELNFRLQFSASNDPTIINEAMGEVLLYGTKYIAQPIEILKSGYPEKIELDSMFS